MLLYAKQMKKGGPHRYQQQYYTHLIFWLSACIGLHHDVDFWQKGWHQDCRITTPLFIYIR